MDSTDMTGLQTTRILGIDPGLNTTGYGVIDVQGRRVTLVEGGTIRSQRGQPLEDRLNVLHTGISEVIQELRPATLSLEELYSHYERPRTAILMGHARGVICLAAKQTDIAVHSYSATQVKKMLTGSGRAPKTQMQNAICREFKLSAVPEPADVADALAIALCHYYRITAASARFAV